MPMTSLAVNVEYMWARRRVSGYPSVTRSLAIRCSTASIACGVGVLLSMSRRNAHPCGFEPSLAM